MCLTAALALHSAALLVRLRERSAPAAPPAVMPPARHVVDVSLEPDTAKNGGNPGGGADRADPQGTDGRAERRLPDPPRRSAPATRIPAKPVAALPLPEGPSSSPEPDAVPVPVTPPELTSDLATGIFAEPPRPRPARTRALQSRAPVAAGIGRENTGRSLGSGLGTGTGPGGYGRGSGVVSGRFAFGGPTGAFRADVCFFDPPVRTLDDIRDCEPAGTFYTDHINVPPRSFTQGFPGLTDRTEWFRIEYRGKFTVQNADYYRFRLLSDDGAILYIDGYRIIDNDGQHEPRSREMTITLEAGEHDLKLSYWQGPRENIALQLFVKRYNHAEQLFSPSF